MTSTVLVTGVLRNDELRSVVSPKALCIFHPYIPLVVKVFVEKHIACFPHIYTNMRPVSTRAGDVQCEINGAGIPIVLLHATLHSRHDFDGVIPRLSSSYQTIAID